MEDFKITKRTIDVERVFREKSPGLARWIPGFVFSYLRRVVHESWINNFLYENRNIEGLPFVDAIISGFGANVVVKGLENIPTEGRCILASNHPLGGLDGVALMQAVGKRRSDIIFPVNDILTNLPNLQVLFIPINKHGSNSENIQIIQNTFESDKMVLYFPAGLVSRKQKGKIEDLAWKKTFIAKSVQYKRDVIPIFIKGQNSTFFYNLANFRKKLGIKANIEMLYLVDEMFKYKNKTIEIIIGQPIPYKTFDKRHNFTEWADLLKRHVYNIGSGYTGTFIPD
ncbi:MAG: 1-acyl-sn-glycerol-3-phosphate acyltransferase [Bacteroidales bacterium]